MITAVNALRAATYVRKSTDQRAVSEDQKSIATQLDTAARSAADKGCAIASHHAFIDDAISGAEFDRRDGLNALLAAIEKKPRPFDWLIISEASRLGRAAVEASMTLQRIIQAGVRVWAYLDNAELTMADANDTLITFLKMHTASAERENGSKRTKSSLVRKARAGYVVGNRAFGYDNVEVTGRDGKRSHVERRIHPEKAALVRRIFDMSLSGLGNKRIAMVLNAEGAISPRGGGWHQTAIHQILHRDIYRGVFIWNKTQSKDAFGKRLSSPVARPEQEHIGVPMPEMRLVSDDLWAAVHARLRATREAFMASHAGDRFRQPNPTASKHFLSGLAQCACGAALEVKHRHAHTATMGDKTYTYYRCTARFRRGLTVCGNSAHIPKEKADAAVLDALLVKFITPERVSDIVATIMAKLERAHTAPTATADLTQKLAETEKLITKLVSNIIAMDGSESLAPILKAKEAERTLLKQRLAEQARPVVTFDAAVKATVVKVVTAIRKRLGKHAEAREVLTNLLVDKITWTPEFGPAGQKGYRFTATLSIAQLLTGVIPFGASGLYSHEKSPLVLNVSEWMAA